MVAVSTGSSNVANLSRFREVSNAELKLLMAKRLREAAEVIAVAVRAASSFSTKIPASVKVVGGNTGVYVIAGGDMAPSADPIEYGKRHPLFGKWMSGAQYTMKKRPFLEEAMEAAGDKAAEAFSEVLLDWAKALDLA
jgi:hypothetical protein